MINSVGIFYFSGTGNTEVVTKLLQDEFFALGGGPVDIIKMEDILNERRPPMEPGMYDLIGIGHPVLGFEAPRIVYQFLKTLPSGKDARAFVFKTAADPISINNGASKSIISQLRRKGYTVVHDSLLAMPCNWFLGYDDNLSRQLYNTAIGKVKQLAAEIAEGQERVLDVSGVVRALTASIGFWEALGGRFFGRFLRVTSACTLCEKCVRRCPVNNIHNNAGRLTFEWKCIWCMRCIYACPAHAISPGIMKICVLKEGYNIRKIIDAQDLEGIFVTQQTTGYFKHFYPYIYGE